MKIAWFSPLAPDHSEIANHSERLVGELRARYDARFLAETSDGFFEPAADRLYAATLGEPPAELLRSLNETDVPIYNLGNHPGYFSKTWFLAQAKPGIVILHDLKLHHFYEGIYRERLGDLPLYLASLRKYYGRLGQEAGVAYWKQQVSIDFMAQHFPMTAWAIRNALAVVVHTPHALETVSEITRTPVRLASLAYVPTAAERPERRTDDLAADGSFPRTRRVRVILFGFLNVNRRIAEFLTALAAMPERDRFEVQLVGTVLNLPDVQSAIEALGLRGHVTLHGYVPEAELERLLDAADLAVNLRYPTMGEASGSQLRIWDHALPSLVTLTEGYATLPPQTVCFVRPESEGADIQAHLRRFLERPADYRETGHLGRRWLLEHHLPSMYVATVGELVSQVDALRSRHNRLTLADRVGAASARWLHTAPVTARERFYAASIAELC